MMYDPDPVTSLLSVSDGATVQLNAEKSKTWCAPSMHVTGIKKMWHFWWGFDIVDSWYYAKI